MKRLNQFARIVAIAMMLGMRLSSLAHDFEIDGIYYNITSSTDKIVSLAYLSNRHPYGYSCNITIPETITYNGNTYTVSSIGDWVFSWCDSLTKVTIPNSITSIGDNAFRGCSGLTEVTIPNSVTSIGDGAFRGCTSLTDITIPNSVTSIGVKAFYETRWYNNQPDGILYLDNYCLGYKGTMPIGELVLYNNTRLIEDCAFWGCTGLTSITIPNSVTSIGDNAFACCSGLTSIAVESGNSIYDSRNNCNAIIEKATKTLIVGCQNSIIPNSVTLIGSYAFADCDSLSSITFPSSVTSIGISAFEDCYGLTEVTIPNSVTTIGGCAFYNCTNLTSITIPNSVTSIGLNAFSETGWYNNQPDKILYLDNYCLGYKETKPRGELVLNKNTRLIANYAFYRCAGLTEVTIPNSVTSIGKMTFYGCSNLGLINILNPEPPTCYSNTFSHYESSLEVTIGSLEAYKSADVWSNFTNIKEVRF